MTCLEQAMAFQPKIRMKSWLPLKYPQQPYLNAIILYMIMVRIRFDFFLDQCLYLPGSQGCMLMWLVDFHFHIVIHTTTTKNITANLDMVLSPSLVFNLCELAEAKKRSSWGKRNVLQIFIFSSNLCFSFFFFLQPCFHLVVVKVLLCFAVQCSWRQKKRNTHFQLESKYRQRSINLKH